MFHPYIKTKLRPIRLLLLIMAITTGACANDSDSSAKTNQSTDTFKQQADGDIKQRTDGDSKQQANGSIEQKAKTENSQESVANAAASTLPTKNLQDKSTMSTPTTVILKTSKGDITLELDSEKAPLTVANFLSYLEDGHYDGTIFHRVIPGFMIQGGGFQPGMNQKPTKQPVINEANNRLTNDTFTIAMARTSDPHSATAQFFINVKDNDSLNFSSESGPGWGYAVFGKVTAGEDVVKAIEGVDTGRSGPYGDVPLEDVVIESVTVSK